MSSMFPEIMAISMAPRYSASPQNFPRRIRRPSRDEARTGLATAGIAVKSRCASRCIRTRPQAADVKKKTPKKW